MASSTEDGDSGRQDEIHVWRDGGVWIARDVETGVTSQGETRSDALSMLDEAVALHEGDAGEAIDSPAEEREALRELGVDPDEVADARKDADELPDFMR